MSDQEILMANIRRKASERTDGATPYNIFQETVNYLVIARLFGLASKVGENGPTSKDLADTVIETAEEIHALNPTLIPPKQYADYIEVLRQHPEVAEHLRPLYESAVKSSK